MAIGTPVDLDAASPRGPGIGPGRSMTQGFAFSDRWVRPSSQIAHL
jgi:hypothetical protein